MPKCPGFSQMDKTVTTLPEMYSEVLNDREAHIRFVLPEDLIYFNGHFAGQPILAGVVQIKWVIEMSQQHFQGLDKFKKLEVIKFNRVLMPNDMVILKLVHDVSRNKVQFSYESKAGQHSTGRVVFTAHV